MDPESVHNDSNLKKQIENSILSYSEKFDNSIETESKYKTLSNHEIEYREKEGIQFEISLSKWILMFYKFMGSQTPN